MGQKQIKWRSCHLALMMNLMALPVWAKGDTVISPDNPELDPIHDLKKLSVHQFFQIVERRPKGDQNGAAKFETFGDFPKHWVGSRDVDTLRSLIDSKEKCACYVHVFSSYLPIDDYAEKGGYARIFLESALNNQPINMKLHLCPKVDSVGRKSGK